MLTTRWHPFASAWGDLERLRDETERLFDRYTNGWRDFAVSYPQLCVWEDTENVYAEAELPGMSFDDLEIYVTGGNQLAINGERKAPDVGKGTWHRQERGFGKFARTVTLPFHVEADKIEATFGHGILTIRMPKSEEAKPRKIQVKAG